MTRDAQLSGRAAVSAPEPQRHIPALDGLRGLAILLVVEFHFYGIVVPQSHHFVDRAAMAVRSVGWSGVDLFFVLSGFLITGILYDAKNGAGYFRNFYARRALRIFPLYYGFLVGLLFVLPAMSYFHDNADLSILRSHQGWYWSYSFNIWVSFRPYVERGSFVNGHLWSLAVEEQFYLVWPAVVLLCNRRQFMVICLLIMVAALGLRMYLIDHLNIFAAYNLTPARMDTLAAGAFLAVAVRSHETLLLLERWVGLAGMGAALLLLALFADRRALEPFDRWTLTVGFSALAVLYASLLVVVLTASPAAFLHRAFAHPAMRALGKYSYAMYIFHFQIAVELAHRVDVHGGLPTIMGLELPARLLFSGAATALTLVLAWASWHLYEKHFLKLKVYFARSVPVSAGAGTLS